MKRLIDLYLNEWKNKKDRKVLLVRGARQVGKTYSIKKFGQTFQNYLEVNFEEQFQIHTFFESSLNPSNIVDKLSIFYGQSIKPGVTLLFFDEIQACPNALRSLRFFNEKIPELHVIAADSLLEFAISQIPSFGVGRIHSLFMYPMNFEEFLIAANLSRYANLIKNSSPQKAIDTVFHKEILEHLKIFMLIGGMPEAVKTYLNTNDFTECQKILDNLRTTIFDDFSKYKKKIPTLRLQVVFNSIIAQIGQKFKYSGIGEERAALYNEALDLLVNAGLAYKVYHTSASGLPLGSQINPKKFKVLLFDSGIYQQISGMNLSEYLTENFAKIINKGKLTELFAGLELIKIQSLSLKPQLYYWHREAKSSNAEIDYLISVFDKIYPIEVKAGTKGQMQSMNIFMNEKRSEFGIRISHENFSEYQKIKIFPLYAVQNILTEYVK
jgi:predicted AAA+ superfamily ATPase